MGGGRGRVRVEGGFIRVEREDGVTIGESTGRPAGIPRVCMNSRRLLQHGGRHLDYPEYKGRKERGSDGC